MPETTEDMDLEAPVSAGGSVAKASTRVSTKPAASATVQHSSYPFIVPRPLGKDRIHLKRTLRAVLLRPMLELPEAEKDRDFDVPDQHANAPKKDSKGRPITVRTPPRLLPPATHPGLKE
eukprot:2803356-Prorocentrum_lima.AAC.1